MEKNVVKMDTETVPSSPVAAADPSPIAFSPIVSPPPASAVTTIASIFSPAAASSSKGADAATLSFAASLGISRVLSVHENVILEQDDSALCWPAIVREIGLQRGRRTTLTLGRDGRVTRQQWPDDAPSSFKPWWTVAEMNQWLEGLKRGSQSVPKVVYLWGVPAPPTVCSIMEKTPQGRLYGPSGLASVSQYISDDEQKRQLGELYSLFVCPSVDNMVLTPPHADGRGLKAAIHFTLPTASGYSEVETLSLDKIGIPSIELAEASRLFAAATQEVREKWRFGEDGASNAKCDKLPWSIDERLGQDPISHLHRLPSRSCAIMMPGVVHFFTKHFRMRVGHSAPAPASAASSSLHEMAQQPPMIGVACDTFTLGHARELTRQQLVMYSREAERRRASKEGDVHFFSFPVLLASLAFGCAEFFSDQPHRLRVQHFLAAVPYIERAFALERAAALSPSTVTLPSAPACAICHQRVFNTFKMKQGKETYELRYCAQCFDQQAFSASAVTTGCIRSDAETIFHTRFAFLIRSLPPSDVVASKAALDVTAADLRIVLDEKGWLSDMSINFYMGMLNERLGRDEPRRVYILDTFFYKKLSADGVSCDYNEVRRWLKKANIVDITELEKVLLPVHVGGNHWCLAVIRMKEHRFEYYDSLGGRNEQCLEHLRQYVKNEVQANAPGKLEALQLDSWPMEMMKDIPRQQNGSDCGVFTIKYAEYVATGRALDFTQADMPSFRKAIAVGIVCQRLPQPD